MPRAPPRLRQLAWLFTFLAVCRLVELALLAAFSLTPWDNPILRGLAVGAVVLLAVDVLIVAFLVALAAGLFLGNRAVFRFVLGNLRAPGVLLLLLGFLSFLMGPVLVAVAVISLILVMAILAVAFNPETRREVEAMDYERAEADAAMAVVARRGFHEAPPVEEEGEVTETELVVPKGWLCPECDGYNADVATACAACGLARGASPRPSYL